MKNLPVLLDGYKLRIVEAPAPKMREDDRGNQVPAVDRDGVRQFVVSLFMRQRSQPGQQNTPKGEEIKVTLESDPGPGFGEDDVVALVDPRVSYYSMPAKGDRPGNSGISFKARGLAPVGAPVPRPAPQGGDK